LLRINRAPFPLLSIWFCAYQKTPIDKRYHATCNIAITGKEITKYCNQTGLKFSCHLTAQWAHAGSPLPFIQAREDEGKKPVFMFINTT